MRLRNVSKTLYHNPKKRPANRETPLTKRESTVKGNWGQDVSKPPRSKYPIYLAVITFLFFIIAIGVAYYVRLSGIDFTVSSSKITIVTQGQGVADSGEPVPLSIRIGNGNPVSVHQAVLSVTYPSGTYKKSGSGTVSLSQQEEFTWDDIQPGEVVEKHIAPIFYGEKGEKKTIHYELKYIPKDSSQPVEAQEEYELLLRAAPLSINTISHTNPIAGKKMTFTMTVQSDSVYQVSAAYMELKYPSGFTPTDFSFKPFNQEKTRFRIPRLGPNDRWKVSVTGIIREDGEINQAIVANLFVIPTGTRGRPIVVGKNSSAFKVNKSFLDIVIDMGQRDDDRLIVSPGDEIDAHILWSNQDTSYLEDVTITATLSGSGLNESSIKPRDNGYFDEVHRQIVWDKKQSDIFSKIRAGKSGKLRIRFAALPDRIEFAQPEKTIQIHISAHARRAITGQVEHIQDVAVGRIDLRSVLQVAESTTYSTNEIESSGPTPPQAGKKTSFVLNYFIKNSGNNLSDVVLRIPFSRDVELTGAMSGLLPGEFEHDEENHVVIITIPSIAATGPESSRHIGLQVTVMPQTRHINQYIPLTKKGSYTAYDTYVDETFKGTLEPRTTRVGSNQSFSKNSRVVAQQNEE